jgi:chromosome segregation ATPase
LPYSGLLGWITAAWLFWLRRHMNRDRYRLTLRGRKARTPRRFAQSIPLSDARKVGLYVDDKMEGKLNEYTRARGAHDERRIADKEKANLLFRVAEAEAVRDNLEGKISTLEAEAEKNRGLLLRIDRQRGYLESLRRELNEKDSETGRLKADVQTLAASRDDAERDFQTVVKQRDQLKNEIAGYRCDHCGDKFTVGPEPLLASDFGEKGGN